VERGLRNRWIQGEHCRLDDDGGVDLNVMVKKGLVVLGVRGA